MSMNDMMREVESLLKGADVASVESDGVEHVFTPHPDPAVTTPVFRAIKEPKKVSELTRSAGYEGRGPTGRIRNIKQMDDPKLLRTHSAVRAATLGGTRPDPEALEKLEEELRYRSWLAGQWSPSYDIG